MVVGVTDKISSPLYKKIKMCSLASIKMKCQKFLVRQMNTNCMKGIKNSSITISLPDQDVIKLNPTLSDFKSDLAPWE